jgi:hypothetical protein
MILHWVVMHQPFASTGSATASDPRRPGVAALLALAVVSVGSGLATSVRAQPAASGGKAIYTCVDERGRRLTADRPIPDCNAREQRVLNSDGSLRDIRPPTMTPQERDAQEARERKAAQARAAQADAERRDRNLLQRYPDEAAHDRARQAALETVMGAQAISKNRLAELERERTALMADAARPSGAAPSPAWQRRFDANEAARLAQVEAAKAQDAEAARIHRRFDQELQRLQALWRGTPLGSVVPAQEATRRPANATPKP